MTLIITKDGKNADKLEQSSFDKEDTLQELIHNNPELIPIYDIQEDKKLFVAIREFPTNSGPIDALAFDADGDIYIIETKLYKNTDKRTVVAQALDYGAALWKHFNDFNQLLEILDRESFKKFSQDFKSKLTEFFSLSSDQLETWLDRVRINLNEGSIKFVILMDSMDERLKDLILYVNLNSQFDIYAVHLRYYKYSDFEITIPMIFGVEVKKNIATYSVGKQWNEQTMLNLVETNVSQLEAETARKILAWSKSKKLTRKWGRGKVDAGASIKFQADGKVHELFNIATLSGNKAVIWLQFGYYKDQPPLDSLSVREEILNRFNLIDGVSISRDNLEGNKFPHFNLKLLRDDILLKQFIDVNEWMLEKITSI